MTGCLSSERGSLAPKGAFVVSAFVKQHSTSSIGRGGVSRLWTAGSSPSEGEHSFRLRGPSANRQHLLSPPVLFFWLAPEGDFGSLMSFKLTFFRL